MWTCDRCGARFDSREDTTNVNRHQMPKTCKDEHLRRRLQRESAKQGKPSLQHSEYQTPLVNSPRIAGFATHQALPQPPMPLASTGTYLTSGYKQQISPSSSTVDHSLGQSMTPVAEASGAYSAQNLYAPDFSLLLSNPLGNRDLTNATSRHQDPRPVNNTFAVGWDAAYGSARGSSPGDGSSASGGFAIFNQSYPLFSSPETSISEGHSSATRLSSSSSRSSKSQAADSSRSSSSLLNYDRGIANLKGKQRDYEEQEEEEDHSRKRVRDEADSPGINGSKRIRVSNEARIYVKKICHLESSASLRRLLDTAEHLTSLLKLVHNLSAHRDDGLLLDDVVDTKECALDSVNGVLTVTKTEILKLKWEPKNSILESAVGITVSDSNVNSADLGVSQRTGISAPTPQQARPNEVAQHPIDSAGGYDPFRSYQYRSSEGESPIADTICSSSPQLDQVSTLNGEDNLTGNDATSPLPLDLGNFHLNETLAREKPETETPLGLVSHSQPTLTTPEPASAVKRWAEDVLGSCDGVVSAGKADFMPQPLLSVKTSTSPFTAIFDTLGPLVDSTSTGFFSVEEPVRALAILEAQLRTLTTAGLCPADEDVAEEEIAQWNRVKVAHEAVDKIMNTRFRFRKMIQPGYPYEAPAAIPHSAEPGPSHAHNLPSMSSSTTPLLESALDLLQMTLAVADVRVSDSDPSATNRVFDQVTEFNERLQTPLPPSTADSALSGASAFSSYSGASMNYESSGSQKSLAGKAPRIKTTHCQSFSKPNPTAIKTTSDWQIDDHFEWRDGFWQCRSPICILKNGDPNRIRRYGVYAATSSTATTRRISIRAKEHSARHSEENLTTVKEDQSTQLPLIPVASEDRLSTIRVKFQRELVQREPGGKFGKWGDPFSCGVGGRLLYTTFNNDPTIYAVKKFKSRRSNETKKEHMKKITADFCIPATLNHQNIIETYDLMEIDGAYYSVMAYAEFDLFSIIMSGKMSRPEIYCVFKQIVSAVDHLHFSGIAHRDLRLDNFLVTNDGTVKLIDFACAVVVQYPNQKPRKSSGIVGADPYLAPEVLSGVEYDGRLADVWSVGIIFYCMILKRFPWKLPDVTKDASYRLFAQSHPELSRLPDEADSLIVGGKPLPSRAMASYEIASPATFTFSPDSTLQPLSSDAAPSSSGDSSRSEPIFDASHYLTSSALAAFQGAPSMASTLTFKPEGHDSIFRLLPRETRSCLTRMLTVEPDIRCSMADLLRGGDEGFLDERRVDAWLTGFEVCQGREMSKGAEDFHEHAKVPREVGTVES